MCSFSRAPRKRGGHLSALNLIVKVRRDKRWVWALGGGRADGHRAVRAVQTARANSLLHGIPSFASVYLDFFHPLDLFEISNIWKSNLKFPAKPRICSGDKKDECAFFLAFEVPRVLIRIENRVTIRLPGLFFFLRCVFSQIPNHRMPHERWHSLK